MLSQPRHPEIAVADDIMGLKSFHMIRQELFGHVAHVCPEHTFPSRTSSCTRREEQKWMLVLRRSDAYRWLPIKGRLVLPERWIGPSFGNINTTYGHVLFTDLKASLRLGC